MHACTPTRKCSERVHTFIKEIEEQEYYTYRESDYTTVEDRRERKVELAGLRGVRAGKHQWRTHHNAAQQSSFRPALQESHLQGSEQVIGMLQSLMLWEEELEQPCVLCWSSIAHLWFSSNPPPKCIKAVQNLYGSQLINIALSKRDWTEEN